MTIQFPIFVALFSSKFKTTQFRTESSRAIRAIVLPATIFADKLFHDFSSIFEVVDATSDIQFVTINRVIINKKWFQNIDNMENINPDRQICFWWNHYVLLYDKNQQKIQVDSTIFYNFLLAEDAVLETDSIQGAHRLAGEPCTSQVHPPLESRDGIEPSWTVLQTIPISRSCARMDSVRVERTPADFQSAASTELAYCPEWFALYLHLIKPIMERWFFLLGFLQGAERG